MSEFVQKEKSFGALIGPFPEPLFKEWSHVSPIMSRPKADPTQRRIITDLTFPREESVNAYIRKNTIVGEERTHSLPTVDAVVERVIQVGQRAHMFTVDVSRAYKNFRSCPLDWPLLNIEWDGKFYTEVSMPFGARASSSSMQRIVDAIVRILAARAVVAHMYLDDMVVFTATQEEGIEQYGIVSQLLQQLGLPEATEKTQMPAKKVRWLGIQIDSRQMTLSIPKDKLAQTLELVDIMASRRSINKKQLQSMIGKLLHVAKCIRPARTFVARLLMALREMSAFYTPVTQEMRADLEWFQEFGRSWNGVAMIPATTPTKSILVDACLTGIGGADDKHVYAAQIAPEGTTRARNIADLEAVNVVVAMHTLLSEADRGGHIVIYCDNSAAVSVLQTGRGRDPFLLECARAAWMAQAIYQVQVTYKHIAGANNTLADALSRAHISRSHRALANDIVNKYNLQWCDPCLHVLNIVTPSFVYRSGVQHTGRESGSEATEDQGTGDLQQQAIGRGAIPPVLPHVQHPAGKGQTLPYLYVHRGSVGTTNGPTHSAKPYSTRLHTLHNGRRITEPSLTLQGGAGITGDQKEKGLHVEAVSPHAIASAEVGHGRHSTTKDVQPQSGGSHHVLRCLEAGRATPADSQNLRPGGAPDQGRHMDSRWRAHGQDQARQKHAVLQPEPNSDTTQFPVKRSVPHQGGKVGIETNAHSGLGSTDVCVPTVSTTHPSLIHQESLVVSRETTRVGPIKAHYALNSQDGCNSSIRRGLSRAPDQRLWRLGLKSLPGLYKQRQSVTREQYASRIHT